jgi:hypothetical protein
MIPTAWQNQQEPDIHIMMQVFSSFELLQNELELGLVGKVLRHGCKMKFNQLMIKLDGLNIQIFKFGGIFS